MKGGKLINPEIVFGQVLQEIRQQKGLSQEGLGFESGYHRTYVSLLERGRKSPSLTTIFQLARALGVMPSFILERVESRLSLTTKRDKRKPHHENHKKRTAD